MKRELEAPPPVAVEPSPLPQCDVAPTLVPGLMTPAAVVRLQRNAGNVVVARLLQRDVAVTGEPTEVAPTAETTGTVGDLPQMADTAGPLDREDAVPKLRGLPSPVQMQPKATKDSPFVTQNSTFPGWDALVTQRPASDPPAPGFVTVSQADQEVPELKITDGLYIGGTPKADDVQQGMVGDCWNLAVVAAIAGGDPGKIMATISATDTGVTASFFRRKTVLEWVPPQRKTVYEPVRVSTSGELPFTADEAGRKTAKVNGMRQIHGAQLRRGAHAIDKRWWVEMASDKAVIHSSATYEVARWSPLLEKAYSIFAAKYGQYGGTGADGEKSGGKSYGAIEGGDPQSLYSVFYGEQGDVTRHPENVPSVETAFAPGTNVLIDNVGVIRQLLPLQGRPDQAAANDPGNVPLVTAATSSEMMFKRLAETIDYLVSLAEYEKLITSWTRDRIGILRKKLQARTDMFFFPAMSKGAALLGTDKKTKDEIVEAARRVLENRNGDDLYRARSHERIGTAARNVADLILDAMNAGTDSSVGQRNLYGEHVYTVVSCQFADASGGPVVLPPSLPADKTELMKVVAPVSQEQSTVRLRNPHHGNEPDEWGDNAPSRPESGASDDGLFTMSLTQFILNTANVSSFVAPHS